LTIKDGRVRADPQRQRRDGYQCEARAAAEQAHSVAHILPQRFKISDAVHLISSSDKAEHGTTSVSEWQPLADARGSVPCRKTNLRAKGSRKT
jgi:hypothetical protein